MGSMAVKQLVMVVFLVATTALAVEVERRERRVHPSLLTSCIAEQLSSGLEEVKKYIKENNIRPPPPPKKDPLADQLTALVFKRHCIVASSSGEEEAACNSCFESHLPGNLNSLPSPEEHFRSLATCAATHLTPLYDSCTELLQQVIKDPRANGHLGHKVFLCFTRVVTQHQVEECAQEVKEVTSEALLEVMGCGTHSVNTWVRDNVSPPPPPPL